jgi:tRNA dimethylallyltransferase
MIELLKQCWFLAGPTASGKTAVSLNLAQRIGAEVVAMDSMTLYRGMDIGTAKPTREEQSQVPHHLIDILDPDQEFTVVDYLAHAELACREIILRGRVPLFVGGTGLYLRSLLRGVFDGPSADWSLRQRLEETARTSGPQALYDELMRIDPQTAKRLHPNDERRVIRALEVYELTDQPLSSLQQHGPLPAGQRPAHVYWLSPARGWLYRRIDERVERMVEEGLIDEVRRLIDGNRPFSHTARQALGYKEVIDWLETFSTASDDEGNSSTRSHVMTSRQALVQSIQTRTRQFAKRQHTWFRNLEECRAVPITGHESPEEIVDRLLQLAGR